MLGNFVKRKGWVLSIMKGENAAGEYSSILHILFVENKMIVNMGRIEYYLLQGNC